MTTSVIEDTLGLSFIGIQIVEGTGELSFRAKKAEAILKGKTITDELLAEAAKMASEETSPITGIEASGEYKKELAGTLVKRVGKEALARAQRA